MTEDIKKILEIAVWAPSGDNIQPWRFEVKNEKIKVFIIPEKDTSLYNYKQNANYIAAGALIENIVIIATQFQYNIFVNLFPSNSMDFVAEIILKKDVSLQIDSLSKFILKRHTNRKYYNKRNIENEIKTEIIFQTNLFNDLEIVFVEDKNSKEVIAKATSFNEKIVMEDRSMHDFFFNHITWTKKEDEEKKGFFVKTLNLKPPQLFIFKLLRSWKRLSFLRKILPISDFIAKENAKIYKSSNAFLAIITDNLNPQKYVETGRCLQRIWLVATKHNIAVQPLIGFTLLVNRIIIGAQSELQERHVNLLKNIYKEMKKKLNIDKEIITLLRIGYAESTNARTVRKYPEVKFIKK